MDYSHELNVEYTLGFKYIITMKNQLLYMFKTFAHKKSLTKHN